MYKKLDLIRAIVEWLIWKKIVNDLIAKQKFLK